ncbi:MAG: serpin family protein [Calditrichaeota bacterium]|nr:serpin family protein [Calditrichota bacterium]
MRIFTKTIPIALLTIILLFVFNCSQTNKNVEAAPVKNISRATNTFGVLLLRKMVAMSNEENVVISPISISAALSMTLNGADKETLQTMKKALSLEKYSSEQINRYYRALLDSLPELDREVQLKIGNAIWYRDEFRVRSKFKRTLEKFYHAEINEADFKDSRVVDEINGWVQKSTNGKISNIIDRVNPADVMYLLNAVYFKGMWQHRFDERATEEAVFYPASGNKTTCQMMKASKKFVYFEDEKVQVVHLPYGSGEFEMVVILPQENVSLDSLVEQVDTTSFLGWLASGSKETVALSFPKFKIKYKKSLKSVLSQMGMRNAFQPGADFSKMVKDEKLNISDVKHKTFIEVNEKGTEAAAVTGVTMVLSAARPSRIYRMEVNRPFLFVITEKKFNDILFMGKIGKPE